MHVYKCWSISNLSDFGIPPPFVNMLDVGDTPKGLNEGEVWVEKTFF